MLLLHKRNAQPNSSLSGWLFEVYGCISGKRRPPSCTVIALIFIYKLCDSVLAEIVGVAMQKKKDKFVHARSPHVFAILRALDI